MGGGRVLFFSAPCGFSKTALAEALLRGQDVLRLSAGDEGLALPPADGRWRVLLLDDLQNMQDENDWNALCELIRSGADRRFVLLSRGAPPGCLIAFRYTGLMAVLGVDDLLFDCEDARRLLHSYGVEATEGELTAILRESAGSPLGIAVTARGMSGGKPFSQEVAAFESFDLEMARMVSGNSHAGGLLSRFPVAALLPRRVADRHGAADFVPPLR